VTRPIILALPKGRILDETATVFARAGYDLSPVFGDNRRLVHECGPVRVLVLRSSDVPTYVAHGAADAGVVGSDVLDEEGRDLYEPLDLGIGRCRMIVAERRRRSMIARNRACGSRRYPRTTRAYLRRGLTAEDQASGAIELATDRCASASSTSRRPARPCARTGSSRSTRSRRSARGSSSTRRGSSSTANGSAR
jgi:ATP phosphoribosyltransferase